jgi:hypothetical protein
MKFRSGMINTPRVLVVDEMQILQMEMIVLYL